MISLNTIAGILTEDTMQVYISIGNEQFVALLNLGSTHNFIHGRHDPPCRPIVLGVPQHRRHRHEWGSCCVSWSGP